MLANSEGLNIYLVIIYYNITTKAHIPCLTTHSFSFFSL